MYEYEEGDRDGLLRTRRDGGVGDKADIFSAEFALGCDGGSSRYVGLERVKHGRVERLARE
ncbi:MAG: hypothetical protein NVS9B4_18510 [Candidatus Acidiferrum sp.]